MSIAEVFARDHDRMNAALRAADAVVTEPDGFQWVDASKVPPSLLSAYNGLVSFGYANGLLA